MGLTAKQHAFVDEYLRCWNASEAARRAGYSSRTAGAISHKLLKVAEIEAAIQERLAALTMGADETLVRLGEQARAAYAVYIRPDGTVDLAAMKRDGKMYLVKAIKYTAKGRMMVEFHDAQAALFKVAQVHGLPKERVEATIDDRRSASESVLSRLDGIAARLGAAHAVGGTGADSAGDGGA
jgi:hypothetical protein